MYAPITEAEGTDRTDIGLPGLQLALVQMLARMTAVPLVVILVHGGPLDIAWLEASNRVDAVLTTWYPGQVRRTGKAYLFGAYQ